MLLLILVYFWNSWAHLGEPARILWRNFRSSSLFLLPDRPAPQRWLVRNARSGRPYQAQHVAGAGHGAPAPVGGAGGCSGSATARQARLCGWGRASAPLVFVRSVPCLEKPLEL